MRGTVEGNVFVTERCELQAGCTLRGDIEAPRPTVDETATFVGSAKVGAAKVASPVTFAACLYAISGASKSHLKRQVIVAFSTSRNLHPEPAN
jgi:cytoskeletal protein CcmA (bactofilin family)